MRWAMDILAVLTAVALIGAVVLFQQAGGREEALIERATADVRRLELEVKYRAVTRAVPLNDAGWPAAIDPRWFDDGSAAAGAVPESAPRNTVVSANRPWLEVAREADAHLENPRVRMTVDEMIAGFWYNPYQGVVRARVPVAVSDAKATELYNRINGTAVASVLEAERAGGPPPAVSTAAAPVRASPAPRPGARGTITRSKH